MCTIMSYEWVQKPTLEELMRPAGGGELRKISMVTIAGSLFMQYVGLNIIYLTLLLTGGREHLYTR
jgi:hypothetical protein